MTFLDETISAISDRFPLVHLGAEPTAGTEKVESLKNAALLALDGVRDAIRSQADELKKWQRLGRVATTAGLVLLLISCCLFIAGLLKVGAVSGLAGILVEVLPVLIFRQIESARASSGTLLPDSMHLFSMVVLLDYAERNPNIADSIIGMFHKSG